MGQAKLKGDRESRVASGIAAVLRHSCDQAGGRYVFARLFPGATRALEADLWLERTIAIAQKRQWPAPVREAFVHVLAYILIKGYQGACHSTSAALTIVLREHGLEPQLCIGEVQFDQRYFDHSWVEFDGVVLDAAVSAPLPGGAFVGGPVFASLCLDDGEPTVLGYGATSGLGLGVEAIPAAGHNLLDYSRLQPTPTIWELAAGVLNVMGHDVSTSTLKDKYGHLTRTLRAAAN